MNILFVTSEILGLVKTGGLADVADGLTRELTKAGHSVKIILPHYQKVAETIDSVQETRSLVVNMGGVEYHSAVHKIDFEGLEIYLLEYHQFFMRHPIYDDGIYEYLDNPLRFCLLSKAALEISRAIDFRPDIIHTNDWQTGPACYYLDQVRKNDPFFKHTSSLLTIHNAEFQGKFNGDFKDRLDLWDGFHSEAFEHFQGINLLKGGIFYADHVVPVSQGYAEELLTHEGGHGLHMSFEKKGENFSGILNGCNYDHWNPASDPLIPHPYTSKNLSGKEKNKAALQKEANFEENSQIPLIGIVCRLTAQKGLEYLIPALYDLMHEHLQVFLLGSGEKSYEGRLRELEYYHGDKFRFFNGYDEALSHRIEAGSDFFLMPSLFEPCGLNQIYSLRYGTLPIVRSVGGLKETVINYDGETSGKATGFVFQDPADHAVSGTVRWAISATQKHPKHKQAMMERGMRKKFTWNNSAKKYLKLYQKLRARRLS